MRDGKIVLPLSVPRAQLISDMEYFGIDFNESQITLNVADPKDMFHELATYRDFFLSTQEEINARCEMVVVEKFACAIASKYFETLITPVASQMTASPPSSFFDSKSIEVEAPKDNHYISIGALQPYLTRYGLRTTNSVYNSLSEISEREGKLIVRVELLSPSHNIGMQP